MRVHSTKVKRAVAMMALVLGASTMTPSAAHAESYCNSLAAGAFRAVYNTTGSVTLAYHAATFQYNSCRAVEWLTS